MDLASIIFGNEDIDDEKMGMLHEFIQRLPLETLEDQALRLAAAKPLTIKIFVKPPEGETLCIETEPTSGISGIKRQITRVLNVHSDQQKLFLDGKLLDDDNSNFLTCCTELANLHISEGTVLDLVFTKPEMIIYARRSNGKILTLKATDSTTVEDVKTMIEVQGCMPVDQQRLVFGNKILDKDSDIICSHGIQSQSTLHILRQNETIVFIKTQTGKVITCDVTSSSTIAELKQVVFSQEHIPTEQQCISLYNTTLANDKTLEQYCIRPGSLLCVTEPGAIQINLNFGTMGGTVPLVVMPGTTILEVKVKIQEINKKFPVEEQQIYYAGSRVKEDCTLTHYSVGNMSTLDVAKCNHHDILLFIKFADGRVITVNHFVFEDIKSLKRKIFLRKGIPINQQKLFCGSQELDDQKRLSDYGIKSGCTLQLFKDGKSRVFVTKQEGYVISQEIALTDSVRNFKDQILAELNINADQEQWELVFAGQQLDDDHKMRDYHIQSGSMLHLLSFEDKLIYLQMPSGEVICQILRISNTVRGINLMGKDCTSPNQQQLMFAGKELENDLFLADCGIEYGSVVHSVFGLRSKMMISVQFPTSSTITVEVTPSSTVAEIKAKIYGPAFSSSDHQLYYGRCQLESTWSLQEYNIQENAVLQLLNPANDVCLFIHTSAEKTFALVVSRNISGSKLKKKIHKRLSIPPVDQKLFLSGKTLESESTLSGTPTVAALYVLQTEEMLIEIQSTFAKSFALVVSRFIAVCDLNLKIQQHEDCTHVSPSKQKLIFDQKVLDNDCSLSECNVSPGSTVLLLMPKDISLYIKVLSQETMFSLAAKPSNTIAEIKRRIAILLNIPMDQQRLLFEMKRLNDVCTLQECEVVDGSSLLLATYSHDKTTNSKMNVFIRNPSGEITKLAIRPNVTIPELKQQIFAENAILPSQQKLFCGSQALHGEDHLLDYEVQTNSILDVVPPGNMLVFIKPLEGNPFNLTTTPTSTVCAIKRMIRTKTGTPLHEQQITFCNQVLDENHTLLQCNVGQLSTLILLSPTEFHIYVQLLNGNIIAQSLSSRTTVGELKNVVRTKDCLLQTEILFNGHVLNNVDTLAKYNVQNESILYEVRGFQAKVQLFLNSPHVKTSMLEVYPLTTILEAKTMLHEFEGLPLDEQEFFLHDKQLENSFTFMDYDVQNKSTLNVQLVKPGDILLTVNTLKSTFPLTMPQSATIKDTMAKIQEEESIPLERMSLYIADKWERLESDRTLADYNLPKVAALEVVGRCRRGVPILIKTLTGDTVRVVVTPINTVKELRDKIKKQHGISVSPLQLIHANQQLEDKKMMKEYKLLNEATVHMLEPEEMLINVQTRETEFQLIVTSSQTVSELKSKLCTLTSIQPVQQLLSISKMGSELKNEYTLLQCGIKGGTLLHLAKGIAKDGMKVTIHSSEGEKSLTVKRDQLVIELKSTIRELTYTPVHQQRVIFASQHLADRQSLRHYNVSARCQLHVLKPDEVLIYVKLADDDNDESMVSLIVSSSITVEEVKKEFMCHHEATAKACCIAHTSSDWETLYRLLFRQLVCDGISLEDDMTLIQCNVQNESLLFLVQQLPVVEIVLKTSDKAYALKVKQSAKILKFKSMIAEETGISPNQQKLVYAGQQLEDDRNLADYNIQDDSKLYVLNQNEVILFVTTPDCGTVILMVSLESNIEEVKDKIEEMLCISSDIQELVHMDVKLKDHKKLSHYCTQTCSVIYVVPAANPRISVKVETSTEKQFCIRVMDSLTIHELRECIQDKEGIPSDQQIRFTYDSQELEDDHTLNECNIREDSIVHLELGENITLKCSGSNIPFILFSYKPVDIYMLLLNRYACMCQCVTLFFVFFLLVAAILELVTDNSLKQSAQEECTVIEVTHSIESGEQEALYLGDSTASEYFQVRIHCMQM